MKDAVLVLGCGNSRNQNLKVADTDEEVAAMGDTFDENFHHVWTIDMDPEAKPKILWDLTDLRWPVPRVFFDEIHAYEVLEHLTRQGEFEDFFALWRKIHDCLKPGGLVCATTPWWESMWVWQDPGHKMCYSPGLLSYLSQQAYKDQVGTTAMTDYRKFWPKEYNLEARYSKMSGTDPKNAGYQFILERVDFK